MSIVSRSGEERVSRQISQIIKSSAKDCKAGSVRSGVMTFPVHNEYDSAHGSDWGQDMACPMKLADETLLPGTRLQRWSWILISSRFPGAARGWIITMR